MSLAVGTDMRELMGQDQDFRTYHASELGIFLTNFAYLAYRRGESADADRLLKESISLLSGIAGEHPDVDLHPILTQLLHVRIDPT